MAKLTKREKTLLYLLAAVAILAGVLVYVIQPLVLSADKLDEAAFDARQTIDQQKLLIAQADALLADIEKTEADIEAERAQFLPAMTNDALDAYITGMLQKHGLTAESLEISKSEDAMPLADVVLMRVDVTARGNLDAFMALADTVKNTAGLRIANLTLRLEEDAVATPSPTPTPEPAGKAAEAPAETPAAAADSFRMEIGFAVLEYAGGGK